jgi:hypothetical protein
VFLVHPDKGRFSKDEFLKELDAMGLDSYTRPVKLLFGDYLLGTAKKAPENSDLENGLKSLPF